VCQLADYLNLTGLDLSNCANIDDCRLAGCGLESERARARPANPILGQVPIGEPTERENKVIDHLDWQVSSQGHAQAYQAPGHHMKLHTSCIVSEKLCFVLFFKKMIYSVSFPL